MNTVQVNGVEVFNKKENKKETIIGTDWFGKLVVMVDSGVIHVHDWDYAKYIYGINIDDINKILTKLKPQE